MKDPFCICKCKMELLAAEKNYLDEDLKMYSTVRDSDLRHHTVVL